MKGIYSCVPEVMHRKEADPFDYKLRSLAEVQHQMRFFFPDFLVNAEMKKYTAGDYRRNDESNLDDRDRISKIRFDIRDMQL